ncbi:OmpA domain protein [Fulvivirga imtechensis AK7]|uniref:OmpA domain protein n=1 Tax=Fulvivirga imtechensis AK7 TaxID=1237149 RepID=L8JGU7_9BACT|nr:OmpA family protein [Fulvivirga imtechensis]ELR68091.1 OmpA domain protein [Fulvivirga imtechensis AK7]
MALKHYFIIFIIFIPLGLQGQQIIRQNLGPKINTSYSETKPIISPDGKTLFFARQNFPANIKGVKDEQDIYYSLLTDGEWSVAVNIGAPLNDKFPNGVSSVSPDGNRILVLNAYRPDGSVVSGASISSKVQQHWQYPERIYIDDFYNKNAYVDYYISNDEKILLLAIETNESQGDQDLYVSFKTGEFQWSKPVNLGAMVNTAQAEFAPFLAADNKTLFFASMGHDGYGDSDIFYSKRLDDSWQNWTKPVNLGPEVNSKYFEAYYTIPASGDYAYYVSTNHSIEGSKDIFKITLPYKFRPDPVLLISGTVFDKSTKAPVEADISFINLPTRTEEGSAQSSPENGDYKMIVHRGMTYEYLAKKSGYIGIVQYKDLKHIEEYEEIDSDLALVPVREGQLVDVHNIFFEQNTDKFSEEAFLELDRFVSILEEYPQLQIEIGGHTAQLGTATENLKLSEARAEMVKTYFTERGIHPERLITKGYGSMEPFKNIYRTNFKPETDPHDRIVINILSTTWVENTDKDNDGIIDDLDRCPNESGPAQTNGCPDRDGDLVIDRADDCPDVPGVPENNGCPEVAEEVKAVLQEALEGIEFELPKDIITPLSYSILDKVVKVMKDNPDYKLKISGHTDNQGDPDTNLILSHKRAQATKRYLEAKGIDTSRLDATGYGEAKPIADNDSPEGRARNRRVEFKIIF